MRNSASRVWLRLTKSRLVVNQSKNGEYIFLSIDSDYEPTTNEVWFKSAQGKSTFTLYSPMKYGVSYSLQQSGEYFYVLTNENQPHHHLCRARIPYDLLFKHESTVPQLEHHPKFLPATFAAASRLPAKSEPEKLTLRQGPRESEDPILTQIRTRQTPSQYFMSRSESVEAYNQLVVAGRQGDGKRSALIKFPEIKGDVFTTEKFGGSVDDFSVFQHYLLALVDDLSNPYLYGTFWLIATIR